MIIYITLEVANRELSGHLLFALNAVARGHQVVIVSCTDIWLYKRMSLLPVGAYLIKNISSAKVSEKTNSVFLKSGFDIYSHEQEPSILWNNMDEFFTRFNLSPAQYFPMKAVFCWGQRDTAEYRKFFKQAEVFFNTGSPRSDLWKMAARDNAKINKESYILVVSNFPGLLFGKRHFSENLKLLDLFDLLPDHTSIQKFLSIFREEGNIGLSLVSVVLNLLERGVNQKIIIRPHPQDNVQYWKNVFNKHSNIKIIGKDDSISPWISGAMAVLHNGCTSAVEAVLQKVPVITYGPDRVHSDLGIPNQLGIRANSIEELEQALEQISDGEYKSEQARSEELLKPLITTGDNAALKVVRIMEEKSLFPADLRLSNLGVLKLQLVRHGKDAIDLLRRLVKFKPVKAEDYMLDAGQIQKEVAEMAKMVDLPVPRIRMISKTGILIEKNSRD